MMAAPLPRLGIVGAGRVGQTLAVAAQRAGYTIGAVNSRRPESAQALAARTHAVAAPDVATVVAHADVVLLAVPDDAIAEVDAAAAADWRPDVAVVHHSGLHPASVLRHAAAAGAATGAFHPLQSISNAEVGPQRLPGIAFGISGDARLLPVLKQLALDLGGRPLFIPDEAKASYHAAAVFASNYLVTCFAQAVQIFAAIGIGEEEAAQALLPLAQGAAANLAEPGLPAALTGPLTRGDAGTIASHRQALAARHPHLLPLYDLLAQASLSLVAQQKRLNPTQIERLAAVLQQDVRPLLKEVQP